MENQYSYFCIIVDTNIDGDYQKESFTNQMDLVLASIQCLEEPLIFERETETPEKRYVYLFKTSKRKRRGQVNKFCERYLDKVYEFNIQAMTKRDFQDAKIRLNKNEEYQKLSEADKIVEYEGKDLDKFQNPENWRKWQLEIYQMLFDIQKPSIQSTKNNNWKLKDADERKIINIVDKYGKSGKSQFFKYLYIKNEKQIGRISYGSAAQLRSSLVNLGEKKIYIIDLPRTKGKYDSHFELLSVIEELKSGCVINAMYGRGNSLIIEPPHIIISTNYLLDYDSLSEDRWEVYEIIKERQTLGPVNNLLIEYKQNIKKIKMLKKPRPDLSQQAEFLPKL